MPIRHFLALPANAMKSIIHALLFLLGCATVAAQAGDQTILAEDAATETAYKDGWKAASGGSGFRDWAFQTLKSEGAESYAGFYLANPEHQPDLKGAAIRGKAFGLFANGVRFEAAAAFRALNKPLATGQTFSFLMEHGEFLKKFEGAEPTGGAIGLTLRSGNAAGSVEDYHQEARFEFGAYAGKASYQIYDGETSHESGIALSAGGLSVSFTLVTPETYDLEITTLGDKKTVTLKGRKLGGNAGGKIESFCIFDRNGEKNDAYFNGFQVTGRDE
jgi:hypothetical protein